MYTTRERDVRQKDAHKNVIGLTLVTVMDTGRVHADSIHPEGICQDISTSCEAAHCEYMKTVELHHFSKNVHL